MSAKEAKQNAKVAKAQAKALRPWYKKKRFILPLLLLALILLIVAATAGGDDTGTTTDPAEPAASAPQPSAPPADEPADQPAAGIGDPVQSGDLSFTVTKVECGVKQVGSADFGAKANGQFCLLGLSAENTGDEAATIIGSSQKLLDKQGRQFSADDEASIYMGKDGTNPLIDEINPGNTSKGTLVFDVPKDVEPMSAVLVGGFLGDEVKVDLKS